VVELGRKFAAVGGGQVTVTTDAATATQDADVIYTDTWTSMGQEAEVQNRRLAFPPYQVNRALVERGTPNCIVMHCLPAHRGEEITDEVADGPHSAIFDQAENRLHAQKAILVHLMAG
jgi:ornithine carbamoyltransferase